MPVNISPDIAKDSTIWKCLSLDKFIFLLEHEQLFFASLSTFDNSDPYEGYSPDLILKLREAYINSRKYMEEIQSVESSVPISRQSDKNPVLNFMYEKSEEYIDYIRCVCINCWTHYQSEPEFLWSTYGNKENCVVIRSDVGSLVDAINRNTQDKLIWISKVKYLDFKSDQLTLADCLVNGFDVPLLKRDAFEYENEVRCFTMEHNLKISNENFQNVGEHIGKPVLVDVDNSILIKEVVVSPYSKPPFFDAVKSICTVYGLNPRNVNESDLLKGAGGIS